MFRFLMSRLRGATPGTPPHPAPPIRRLSPGAPTLDVEGMIRQASMRVSVDQLVKNGKKYIQLLSAERIEALINRAVQTIVEKYRTAPGGIPRIPVTQIEVESEAEFAELLEQYRLTSQAKIEVEQAKRCLDQEVGKLRQELERERALRAPRESQTPGDRLRSPQDGSVAESREPERSAPAGLAKENAFLQKRIDKQAEYIASLEKGIKTLSGSKTYSTQQVQNLLRQLGLAQEDRHYEKKKEMLKIVLDANQELRKQAKALEERGITLASPAGRTAPAIPAPSLPWGLGRAG